MPPNKTPLPSIKIILMALFGLLTAQTVISVILQFTQRQPTLFTGLPFIPFGQAQTQATEPEACNAVDPDVDLDWHAPASWEVNNLDTVLHASGTYGFIFDSSQGPADTYNWCNMPHVNAETYSEPPKGYNLEYVEVIHRHHKRTPYAANTFPVEGDIWDCNDEGLFFGGRPLNPYGNASASTYWSVFTPEFHPMRPKGFNGTCQFPQITRGGLDDSHKHGVDLRAVYHDHLGFLPAIYDPAIISHRVTNNVITSQVASMVIAGMWPERSNTDTPLLIQPSSIDSLEPSYPCQAANRLSSSYGPGSSSAAWTAHLRRSAELKTRLDAISGVPSDDEEWSKSYDHYFDNLSARLCHAKQLPCSLQNPSRCVSDEDADAVFRLGEYEYSFLYRDVGPDAVRAATAGFGIWAGELASHLREAAGMSEPSASSSTSAAKQQTGKGKGKAEPKLKFRHNVAHDGSIARLLALLQLDRMVWPGMGAEVVFEVYSRPPSTKSGEGDCGFVRVLWGGQVLESSHPAFGRMEMVPIGVLIGYLEGLVGRNGGKVPQLCRESA